MVSVSGKVKPKTAERNTSQVDRDLPPMPSIDDAERAAKVLADLARRLEVYAALRRDHPDAHWNEDGGVYVNMAIRAIEAAELAREHDAKVDGKAAKRGGVIKRAIWLLDYGRGVANMAPMKNADPRLYTPEHWFEVAVTDVCKRAAADRKGLGLIPRAAWEEAIKAWEGVEVSRAGNPDKGAKPYSWKQVMFGLLKPYGLTDASTPHALEALARASKVLVSKG